MRIVHDFSDALHAIEEAHDQEVEELNDQIASLKADIEMLEDKVNDLEEENSSLCDEIEDFRSNWSG